MATRKTTTVKTQEISGDKAKVEPQDDAETVEQDQQNEESMSAKENEHDVFSVVVLSKFIDKHTGKTHEKGDLIEVTPDRFEEILLVGKYVERQ